MPSTYSTSLRLELIGNGEQAGNWGNTTNTNLGTLIEQAITGVASITMLDATTTLVSGNGVSDEARNAVLVLGGALTATRNLIVPTANKFYAVRNATTGSQSVLVKTSAGTGVTLANGYTQLMYCDGTNVVAASVSYNITTGAIAATLPVSSLTGTLPVANGGTGTSTAFAAGSVVFAGASGVYSQNNSQLFWDNTNNYLGVGTSSPFAKLDVSGSNVVVRSKASSGYGAFVADGATGGQAYFFLKINDVETARITSDAGNFMAFSTGSPSTERMRIDSSGNVGIGTSLPASKLDVNGAIRDSKGDVRTIVQNSQSGAYVLVAADAGKHISITTGGVTVNTSVFSTGDAVTIYNNSASSQTITQGTSVTMYFAGTSLSGNRTLALRGLCTILCVGTNTFVISGAGLT
jgi:redox-sensitive bicupin YhaK (pirin superfamily)